MAVVVRGGKWSAVDSSSPLDREDIAHPDRKDDSESEQEAEGLSQTMNILSNNTLYLIAIH